MLFCSLPQFRGFCIEIFQPRCVFFVFVCLKCVGVLILLVLKVFGTVCFPARRTASSHHSVNGHPVRQRARQVYSFIFFLSLSLSAGNYSIVNEIENYQLCFTGRALASLKITSETTDSCRITLHLFFFCSLKCLDFVEPIRLETHS